MLKLANGNYSLKITAKASVIGDLKKAIEDINKNLLEGSTQIDPLPEGVTIKTNSYRVLDKPLDALVGAINGVTANYNKSTEKADARKTDTSSPIKEDHAAGVREKVQALKEKAAKAKETNATYIDSIAESLKAKGYDTNNFKQRVNEYVNLYNTEVAEEGVMYKVTPTYVIIEAVSHALADVMC